ncbi:MAG: hypothetical protein WAM71_11880 [Candidatus Korobacteraceae bacterium]
MTLRELLDLRGLRERVQDLRRSDTGLAAQPLYAKPRFVTGPEQCFFYHTTDLPIFGTVEGLWDLRGKEDEYLGRVQLKGKRVLEIGPASGGLTFHMERAGAEVVSIEADASYRMEYCWDIPHCLPPGLEEKNADSKPRMTALHDSYWLCHRLFNSSAKVHYGSAYEIPPALGPFDVTTIACVLLHNKNPFIILEHVASVTKETLVIVEVLPVDKSSDAGPIFLRNDNEVYDGWFHFPPNFTARVLRTMGFGQTTISYHEQLHKARGRNLSLYTVVAHRS